jgi:YfiH family protein
MQMKRSGRIQYIAADFPDSASSVQGFTTRHEGVSRIPYNSLNLGINTLDQTHSIEGNRSLLASAFGINHEMLVTVRQIHGNDILVIDEPNEDYSHFLEVECDAIITNQPGVMIGVCVADCVPVLLFDPEKRVIAAVHSGWKGTVQKVAAMSVAAMKSLFGCNPENIHAAIGPSIGKCCYEVDAPIRQAFAQNNFQWELYSELTGKDKWHLSLSESINDLLLSAGLSARMIQKSELCVCCHRELFFSYRRDKGETGRQMGFIMLTAVRGS